MYLHNYADVICTKSTISTQSEIARSKSLYITHFNQYFQILYSQKTVFPGYTFTKSLFYESTLFSIHSPRLYII